MSTKKNNTAIKTAANKKSLTRDQRGLTTVEYIIVLVLIAVTGFAIWRTFGSMVKQKVTGSNTTLDQMNTTSN
ncbi:MAG: hypothetical protein IPK60_06255 [Sandaracinaceae bacterium]|nr:hypothetical protein [Sandaracinaceae bacterium]